MRFSGYAVSKASPRKCVAYHGVEIRTDLRLSVVECPGRPMVGFEPVDMETIEVVPEDPAVGRTREWCRPPPIRMVNQWSQPSPCS